MRQISPSEVNFLAEVPFFKHLADNERLLLAQLLEKRQVSDGGVIFSKGDPGDSLYVIKSGSVEIFVRNTMGDKVMLAVLGEGELFGELSLLDNGPRSASAMTAVATELFVLHRKELITFLADRPAAIRGLLLLVGQRLRQADDMLRGHMVRNLNEVVDHELTSLQRLLYWIADFSGSVTFLAIHVVVFLFWVVWNSGLFDVEQFDPFPYSALCMIVSIEAIFLSIVVLITQNLKGLRESIRSNIEYEANLKAELEVSHLHSKVDVLHTEVLSRLHRLENKT